MSDTLRSPERPSVEQLGSWTGFLKVHAALMREYPEAYSAQAGVQLSVTTLRDQCPTGVHAAAFGVYTFSLNHHPTTISPPRSKHLRARMQHLCKRQQ